MTSIIKTPVIIIGGNHHNTLGVVRAFGESGLAQSMYLIIVSKGKDYVSKSRYIKRSNYRRITSDSEIAKALDSFDFKEIRPVIISCSDKVSSFLDNHYNTLKERFIIPNANEKEGQMNYLMDKTVQLEYAVSVGMNVPISAVIDKDNDSTINWNIYPCIIKPLESIMGAKSDIHICNDKQSLLKDIEKSPCSKFQIQEYINKSVEYQLIGCSWGGVIIPGASRLIRQPKNTNTGYLVYDNNFQFDLSKAVAFIKKIKYRGLFSIELLRDKNGKDYFMEINMRNDGNAYCVTCSGVNIPLIWYKKMLGLNVPAIDMAVKRTIHFMPEFYDVSNIRSIGIFHWLKDFLSAESHANLKLSDPMPFLCQLVSFVRNRI